MAPHISMDEFLDSLDPAERGEAMKPTFMEPLRLFLDGFNKFPSVSEEAKNVTLSLLK